MEPIKLTLNERPAKGKAAAKRLRSTNEIPVVAYGKDLPSACFSVSPKALLDVLRSRYGRNSVLELDMGGKKKVLALVCDYQYHPVSRALLHADFLEIKEDKPVHVDVPLETVGRAKGVVLGGVLRQVFRALPVRCLPKDIPVKLTVDVTELELEQSISVKQLALPEGVSIRLPPEQTVVAIVGEKRRDEEAAGGAAAGAEGAEKGKAAASKSGS